MLSISNPMTPKKAASYHGKDDYYIGGSGIWHGKGVDLLNISDTDKNTPVSIPGGKNQESEKSPENDKNYRPENKAVDLVDSNSKEIIPESGSNPKKINKDEYNAILEGSGPKGEELRLKNPNKRGSFDLTFSAPKSVSILSIFDESLISLHDQAVSNTLNFIEKNHAQTRVQKNGKKEIENTGNLLIAKFTHFVSRELDPQLHTHSVVMNTTQGSEGKWRSLHNDSIYKNKMNFGLIYRNELATLLQKNGFEIEVTDSSQFFYELKGIDKDLIETFSSRRKMIEEEAQKIIDSGKYTSLSHGEVYAIAALGSRKAKNEKITKEELKEYWKKIIEHSGKKVEPSEIKSDVLIKKSSHETNDFLTLRESAFTETEYAAVAAKLNFGSMDLNEIQTSLADSVGMKKIKELGKLQTNPDGLTYFSTESMIKTEKSIIDSVSKGQTRPKEIRDRSVKFVAGFLYKYEKENKLKFTEGQKQAFITALTSSDPINLIQGDAGTGKTAYLKAINAYAKKYDINIIGVGFTGKAAQEMTDAGVYATTIDAFLRKDTDIKKGSLIVMDEASMTGSVHFEEVINKAKGKAKIIIQGDSKQLPAISAGRMHEVLFNKAQVDKVELKESLRQRMGSDARENINAFNSTGIDGLLVNLSTQGNLHKIENLESSIKEISEMCYESLKGNKSVIVLTDTNKSKEQVNEKVRSYLKRAKYIKEKTEREFGVLNPKNLDEISRLYASSYSEGQLLLFSDTSKKGKVGKIISRDFENNKLSVLMNGETASVDLEKDHKKFTLFEEQKKEFAKNDEVIFLKNDRALGVKNGMTGKVEEVKRNGISLAVGKKKIFLDFKSGDSSYRFIDHAYAMTIHKSQGVTSDQTIYLHTDGKVTANSFYVAATRAREKTVVFSGDKTRLERQISNWHIKKSTTDFNIPDLEKIKTTQRQIEIER